MHTPAGHPLRCAQRVVDELQRSVHSLERLRDNFEYKDPQGRDQVRDAGKGLRRHATRVLA